MNFNCPDIFPEIDTEVFAEASREMNRMNIGKSNPGQMDSFICYAEKLTGFQIVHD